MGFICVEVFIIVEFMEECGIWRLIFLGIYLVRIWEGSKFWRLGDGIGGRVFCLI